MKKAIALLTLLFGFVLNTPALSYDGEPLCPSLKTAKIYSVYNDRAYFDLSTYPFSRGGVIEFQQTFTLDEAKAVAKNGLEMTNPTGYAHSVAWGDGSYFWACTSKGNNYSLPVGITEISVLSDDIYPTGVKRQSSVSNESALLQKLELARRAGL